jgi:isopentenyl-diphosphate Delta-isomerase
VNPNEVILVNEQDEAIGTMEKLDAHVQGVLHRAFSIFLFNKNGDMLLQQRNFKKYHSGGLWTNACCSHPMPTEPVLEAAQRRLTEELGISVPIQKAFTFTYKANFENGLIEHEYDHVFIGECNIENINFNTDEVNAIKYISLINLEKDIENNPKQYTVWFKIALPQLHNYLNSVKNN